MSNADDYYGGHAFEVIYQFLRGIEDDENHLVEITERSQIERKEILRLMPYHKDILLLEKLRQSKR